jgi:predicted small secreted protein
MHDKNMKKSFSVCGAILLLMSFVLTGCSGSSGSDLSSSTSPLPQISTTTLAPCWFGQAYSQQISATGGSGAKTFSIVSGALPSGISLSSSGKIAGTAGVAPGVFQFTVMVTDAAGSSSQALSLFVAAENLAEQHPYATIRNNPSYYYVSQDAGLCVATSFYMTMKYYGDHLKNVKTGISDPAEITDNINYPSEVTENSQVARYIQYIDDQFNALPGIHLSSLVKAAEGLLDESGSSTLYSEVMVGNYGEDLTGTEAGISEQKINIFLNQIVPFLNSGSPVLLHLWRSPVFGISLSGHYVLVIGYNHFENVVYFMDPNDLNHKGNQCDCVAIDSSNPDICFIQKVAFNLFIEDYWYKSDDPFELNARWDGNWVGFRH